MELLSFEPGPLLIGVVLFVITMVVFIVRRRRR